MLEGLKAELATYLAYCDDASTETPICNWWRNHECKHILLCQPSSAAGERVFSLLNNSFSDRQSHSLEDYIEISVISLYIKQRGICLFVCLLAWLSGMAGHALYGMAHCFGHTGVTFDAENDRPGPGSLRGHFEDA